MQEHNKTKASEHISVAEMIYRILKADGWQQQRVEDYGGIMGVDMYKDGQAITLIQDFYPNQVSIKAKRWPNV